MTGNDTTTPGGTIIDFARRTGRTGFNLTPTQTLDSPVIEPPNTPTPAPAPGSTGRPGRRSPLDIVSALPDPGILQPAITAPAHPAGHVPDTFRNEPHGDLIGPRLGALSLAAILATAVAALRGTHTVLSTWWENRLARQAETDKLREARLKHQLAMQNIGDKAAQQRAKNHKVPSSSDFGRKSLGNRSSGGSGGGKGPGRSGKGTGSSSGAGAGKGPGSKKHNSPSGSGSSSGSRLNSAGKGGAGRGPGRKNRKDTGPLRTSQRGGTGLKKHKNTPDSSSRNSSGGKGSGKGGRTGLKDALAKDTGKKAAARLKKRRKNLDNPALWSNDKTAKRRRDKKQPGKDLAPLNPPDRTKNRGTKPGDTKTPKSSKGKRTTLSDALGSTASKAARLRLKRRRRTNTPPIWTAPRNRKNTKKPRKDAPNSAGGGQAAGSPKPGPKPSKAQSGGGKSRGQRAWEKARAYTRKKAANGGCFGGRQAPGSDGTDSGPGPTTGTAGTPGGNSGQRRSPFENAGQAAGDTQWTVERDDHVGAQAKRWEPDAITTGAPALPAADTDVETGDLEPAPDTPAPHAPRPAPTPPPAAPSSSPRIQEARPMAAPRPNLSGHRMSDEHATEITLDDSLDESDEFAKDAFKTHDQSGRLAKKAHALREACIQLSEELATKHNLIGRLFQGALACFVESMDLVDRMAQEMELSSLEAAEMAEALSDDLNDAYRPYTQATADAGLTTPSAPIHNRA